MSVREGLLSLLEGGPSYGFHLKTRFEEITGGVWPLNAGQVYTTLDRLERDGFVEVDAADGQKTYRLTREGEDEVGAWWDAVPGDDPPPRDELLIKTLLALPHGREHALTVISRQRTALVTALQARRRRSNASARGGSTAPFAEALVADAVLMRAEADLRWLDRSEARIAAATDAELAGPAIAADDRAESPAGRPLSRRPRATRTRRTNR